MMEVGQLLRQTREAQELSLADVEEKTRIRQSFLIALESGNWDDLPNEVVARGFLRNYAQFLGLDPDDLLAQSGGDKPASSKTDLEAAPAAATVAAAQPSAYKPINLDLYDETPDRSNTLRRILAFVLALIPVVILAYLLVQFGLPLLLDQSAGLTANPTATATLPPEGTPPATPLIVLGGTSTSAPVATSTPNDTSRDTSDDTPEVATETPDLTCHADPDASTFSHSDDHAPTAANHAYGNYRAVLGECDCRWRVAVRGASGPSLCSGIRCSTKHPIAHRQRRRRCSDT